MAKSKKPHTSARPYYPHATVAFYGSDDRFATKAVVAVFQRAQEPPSAIQRWYCKGNDLREDPETTQAIVAWVKSHGVAQSTISEKILGCPHEEGIDYPVGETCPMCPFWKTRRRTNGKAA